MRMFSVAAAVAALALAGEARAQGYGGGFIEALMTGGDPAAVARPVRPAPIGPDGTVYRAPYGYPPAAAYGSPRNAYGPPAAYGEVPVGPPSAGYGPVPGLESDAALVEPMRPVPMMRPAPYAYRPPAAMAAPRLAEPDGRYRRQEVSYAGPHRPGTIVIDTPARQLYLVQEGGRALRYGIGVGRPGFTWSGMKTVSQKREWPDWTPPAEMLKRRPDLPRHMAGGPDNPLGARALYLGSTLYRIHGTNEPHTIGQSVSSGCIRMMNDDVVDLYQRVPVGAKVLVI